jgi:phosphotransferase system enzyme I (PtsI)
MGAKRRSVTFGGLAVAPGLAVGKARIVDVAHFPSQVPRYAIRKQDIGREVERFRAACDKAHKELNELADRVEKQLGRAEAELIRPQAAMVQDPAFIAAVEEAIVEEHRNAEAAVGRVLDKFVGLIEATDDLYLKERGADVRDAGRRVLGHLLFVGGDPGAALTEPCIVVASHLMPSLTVRLSGQLVLGLATEHGGYTSHAAILARALGIPAVTGLKGITDEIVSGEVLVIDGSRGAVIARPSRQCLRDSGRMARKFAADRRQIIAEAAEPAETADGCRIRLQANVGRPEEIQMALDYRADGIGLYRTEFEFLTESRFPSEDELYEHYARAAEAFPDDGVAIRVLDIGGDKFPASIPLAHEENPFLGVRGLRLLLERADELMVPQLRALIRAAARGPISILYPMVSGVEEFDRARAIFRRVARLAGADDLRVPQGLMIEVPSCIYILPELLSRADFASVGTNDLVQYILAADRNSERLADTYDPFHPAVVRILHEICRTGRKAGKPISVCGEIAGDPAFLPLLLGSGYRTLSVNVGAIPYVKHVVRKLNLADCEALMAEALKAPVAADVRRAAERLVQPAGADA